MVNFRFTYEICKVVILVQNNINQNIACQNTAIFVIVKKPYFDTLKDIKGLHVTSERATDVDQSERSPRDGTAESNDVPLNLRSHNVTTHSMTLSWSSPIHLNPVKYKISFDARKEFVNSRDFTEIKIIPKIEIILNGDIKSHIVNGLSPFTTYKVNVSAIPNDSLHRPPAKINVTTLMAAPEPMVKPDFYGVVNGTEILVILPLASEEYGPMSHYYLVVVPENDLTMQKNPDQFSTDELINNVEKVSKDPSLPYIAAKYPQRKVPFVTHLGTGEKNYGFINYPLERGKRYRIFVRAVVNTPQKDVHTSSPYSEFLSLDMREVLYK